MKIPLTLDRRMMIGLVIAALVAAFALTQMIVNHYRDRRQQLAQEWSARGERDLPHTPAVAVVDFETSLSYAPTRAEDRLRLSEALVAANRLDEAKDHLLTLWAEEPGNGLINLELARIAASDRDLTDAVRYYHAAIDGAWEAGAASARRDARLELAKLLLSRGQRILAQAELIALIDDLPADARLVTDVGALLLDAGADNRALGLFQRALTLDPADARASRLAGEIEFRAGAYAEAHRDLLAAEANPGGALDDETRDMLDVSGRVLTLDPYVLHLSTRDRAQRVVSSLEVARNRFDRCGDGSSADSDVGRRMAALASRLGTGAARRQRALERDPELIDQTMALIFDIERLPQAACGPSSPDDRALLIVAAQRATSPQ